METTFVEITDENFESRGFSLIKKGAYSLPYSLYSKQYENHVFYVTYLHGKGAAYLHIEDVIFSNENEAIRFKNQAWCEDLGFKNWHVKDMYCENVQDLDFFLSRTPIYARILISETNERN